MALHPVPQEHTCCACVERLSQDNARLKAEKSGAIERSSRAHQALEEYESENEQLQEDNARKAAAYRRMEDADVQHEAHVAALVRALQSLLHRYEMVKACQCPNCVWALGNIRALLDAPDLAALLAQAQARDEFEKRFGEIHKWLEEYHPHVSKYVCAAYRALDAAEKQS